MVNITEIMRSAIFYDCYSQPLQCLFHGAHYKRFFILTKCIRKQLKKYKVKDL